MLLGLHFVNVEHLNEPLSSFGTFSCEHQPGNAIGNTLATSGFKPRPAKAENSRYLLSPAEFSSDLSENRTLKTENLLRNTASRMQMELQGCNPRGRGFESHRLHSLKQATTRFSTGAVAQSGRARNVSSILVVIGFSVAISLRRDEPY